jgi:hypothetical protein
MRSMTKGLWTVKGDSTVISGEKDAKRAWTSRITAELFAIRTNNPRTPGVAIG